MELSSAGCADCCSDCAAPASACCTSSGCCAEAACCETNCQLLPNEPIRYEYHEPEENFVSIDDAKIKSLLLKIGQQQQQQQRELQQQLQQRAQEQQQITELLHEQQQQQIIELLDDDDTSTRCSPDIQLIPKPVQQHRIVARIELSDSECEDQETTVEKDLPLSCELNSSPAPIIVLQSDDEEQQQLPPKVAAAKKRPTRPYVKRRGRNFYQCQACGKKVQSNYNLRRHMMIHTGERPFPCDLCERRFREFSDLKKHRRRHMNDPRYICMICHLYPPMEQDSTRCVECEGKNLLLNPQDCEEGAAGHALDKDDEDEEDAEPEQEQETDHEIDQEQGEALMSPPVATVIASPPPMLLVTLVPPLPTPPPSATTVVPSVTRSCSSAHSSSSLSNDATLLPQLPARTSRSRRSYPCPLCHRPFGTRHNLKRHYMIHTGEKPFSCSKCRKPFRECSTLKKHMVTHVRDRWYKCLRCPAKYQDYLHYTAHKASHGNETALELGAGSQQLQRSSDSEDGDSSVEDWLECCECQRRFTQLDAYTAHLKQHDLELYGMSVDDVDDEDQEVDVA
ncbi:hypothetical protein KR093_008459 [Drosophila rubida]|uniref:C2H2-type domain-containing protein n=1 Tax=Drosophila rubida TaxID=30044 RepID=A0AAD4K5N8_9MUSC|nr:hypothetical protein KR093_008459 [Drosophila rubida]